MTAPNFDRQGPAPTRRLVLASTSRYRQALLGRLGIPFDSVDPGLDEEPFKRLGLEPDTLVAELASAKARACARVCPDAVIVGGDQCAEVDGEILGKPGTVDRAVGQLRRLAGRSHRLLTAVCVLDAASGSEQSHVDIHRLTLRPLSEAQLRTYVAVDDPVDCAGAYKIESLGIALFERIEGQDATAITGLPLLQLTAMLYRLGIDVLDAASRQRS